VSASAAGYVPVGSELPAILQRLGAFRPGAPVLSLYLDLDPAELPTPRARRSAITSLLDEAHKQIEGYATDHDRKESLRSDLEHATAFFEEWSPKGARGVALFSATLAGFFETVPCRGRRTRWCSSTTRPSSRRSWRPPIRATG
jgi:hypothetical protein